MDIIVDFETLNRTKKEFLLKKNDILKRYEIIYDETPVDIYVPFFSDFVIPFDCIRGNTIKNHGITIPKPEILLILKQQTEIQRKDNTKGHLITRK